MKLIKIYLLIVTLLLIIGLGFGVYVWYTIQKLSTSSESIPIETSSETSKSTPRSIDGKTISEPIVVKTSSLSASQQNMLKTFGITGDTVTITSAMSTCAENSVGRVRLDEILKGASPTTLESMKLLPCIKS